jgi:hypothetical protein
LTLSFLREVYKKDARSSRAERRFSVFEKCSGGKSDKRSREPENGNQTSQTEIDFNIEPEIVLSETFFE